MEDYEKKYKESLERARKYKDGEIEHALEIGENIMEYVFPELKDSKDERIRKAIINVFATHKDYEIFFGVSVEDILAWLEKQGKIDMGISESTKQKLKDNLDKALEKETPESWNEFLDEQETADKIQIGKKYKCIGSPRYTLFMKGDIYKPEDEFICSLMNLCSNCFEPIKDDGQEPADKVKLRFHVGEWIIYAENHNSIYQVERIDNHRYYLRHYLGGSFSVHFDNELIRLWTIQDAKEGDVLAYNDGSLTIFHYRLSGLDEGLYMSHVLLTDKIEFKRTCAIGNVHPATKEQRETMMKAIADAGYTFDFNKKELKLLITNGGDFDTKNCEQNPVWSEEDRDYFDAIIAKLEVTQDDALLTDNQMEFLRTLKNRVLPQPKQEWSEDDERMYKAISIALSLKNPEGYLKSWYITPEDADNWLKSLKERYTWKPSDEQMKALSSKLPVVKGGGDKVQDILESLYDDLKKLREE